MLLTKVNRRRSTAIRSVSPFRASYDRSRVLLRLCSTLSQFYLPLLTSVEITLTQLDLMYRIFEELFDKSNV